MAAPPVSQVLPSLPRGPGYGRFLSVTMAWLTLRAELRQRWRAMAGLAVLLGLVGGVVLTVLLVVPVALLLANLIAAWPGWQAARVLPAVVLRAE